MVFDQCSYLFSLYHSVVRSCAKAGKHTRLMRCYAGVKFCLLRARRAPRHCAAHVLALLLAFDVLLRIKRLLSFGVFHVFSFSALSIRSFAILKYSSSSSMPIKRRFVFTQATPVLPLPMQLSKTVSPSLV